MLKTLRFEALREEHIAQILSIEAESHGAPWTRKSFANELINPHSIFLVALVDGDVAGYGGIWLVIDEAHVTTLTVASYQRRQGIGKAVMIELLKRAKTAGMVCSTLEVRAGNDAAIRLYKDLGYAVTARRKSYYPDNNEDALVMWLYKLDEWEAPRA